MSEVQEISHLKMRFLGLSQTSFIFAIFPLIDRSDEKKTERKRICFNNLLHL